jgi:NAD(P)H dehydrogenase (quinone)
MVLVTGAAGKTGRAVVRALVARGMRVRALVRRDVQEPVVRGDGAGEVVVGDLRDDVSVARAVRGAAAVYHICPNMQPDEVAIGRQMLAAARAARIERFVYHSVLHPQTQAMPHHWQKLLVEECIVESSLAYTILQPASYMQNVLAGLDRITREGRYAVPYAPHTRLGMVDLDDVAAAAAIVMGGPAHAGAAHSGATYELAGGEVLTQIEIAAILTRVLGRPVAIEQVPTDAWAAGARRSGLGAYQIETLLAMFRYYEQNGLWGSPNVLTWLLGRPPGTFETVARRTLTHGTA